MKTPLSIVDKTIYLTAEVIFGGVLPILALIFFGIVLPNRIAFTDETVLLSNNRFGMVISIVLWGVLMAIFLFPIYYAKANRIPIFGNKHFKPKAFERIIPAYSLFSKDFRKNLLPDFDKKVKIYICASVIGLVISLLITPLGLCPRITLDTSDTVKFYNVFNVCVGEYHWLEASDLEIDIGYVRRGSRRTIDIYYTLDGKRRELTGADSMDYEERLRYYIHLKDYFDEGEYTVDSQDMDRLISTNNYNAAEIQLIYELFDYTP